MEKHSVSRMVGSPPGYIGYDEGGQLTEAVRRKPYSVILLDEIEKAHSDVFNILLQILEDGRLTDSKGRTVDFRNTVVVMTANVGAHAITQKKHLGFDTEEEDERDYERMRENVLEELKRSFKPEFLNRIDETIVFTQLNRENILEIADLMLGAISTRLRERGIELRYSDEAKELMAQEGFDPIYGARPLRRTIQRRVEDSLSEEILSGRISLGETVCMDVKEDKLVFTAVHVPEPEVKLEVQEQAAQEVK
jgi:ATP-dependent Clp protease ATP-binding subunit ClpC